MKSIFTFILIVSFIGIAIFGFAVFNNHGMDNSISSCVTSPIDGTPCPANIIEMTLQHISALQTLTTSTIPPVFSLLAFIVLVSLSVFLFYKNLLFSKLELSHQRLQDLALHSLYGKQKITSWLSLFENSPSLSYIRHNF